MAGSSGPRPDPGIGDWAYCYASRGQGGRSIRGHGRVGRPWTSSPASRGRLPVGLDRCAKAGRRLARRGARGPACPPVQLPGAASRASCAQRAMVGFFRALSAPDDYPALVPPSNATQKTPVTGRLLQIKRPGPPSPGRLSCPGRRANSPRGARCGRPVSAAEAPANWPDRSRGAGARAFLSPPEAGART